MSEVLPLATKHFGALQPNTDIPIKRVRAKEPPRLADQQIDYQDSQLRNQQLTQFRLVDTETMSQREKDAFSLALYILGGREASPLAEEFIYKTNPIATGASAGAYELRDYFVGVVSITVLPDVTLEEADKDLEELLAQVLERLKGVNLEEIKEEVLSDQYVELDDFTNIAREMGTAAATDEDVSLIFDYEQKDFQEITMDEVISVFTEKFLSAPKLTGYLRPSKPLTPSTKGDLP